MRDIESGEGSSRQNPSSNPHFSNETLHHNFKTMTFQLVSARYLHEDFFFMFCRGTVEIIDHFNLHKLVYYTQLVNTDLVSEFYNNLRPIGDGLRYTTRVAKWD